MTIRRRAAQLRGARQVPGANRQLTIFTLKMSPGPDQATGRVRRRMFRMFRIFTNLYAKLIASAAIGVLLVAGMILNAQWSNGSVARSNASSRNQNAVVKEVLLAQQSYLRGQIQRRNVVLARNLTES